MVVAVGARPARSRNRRRVPWTTTVVAAVVAATQGHSREPRRVAFHHHAPPTFEPNSMLNKPMFFFKLLAHPPRRGPPHAPSGRSSQNYKAGDWTCTACGAHNFASRTKCFQCGARSPRQRRPRRDPFWKQATETRGPREVVEDLRQNLWWTARRPDLDALDAASLVALAEAVGAQVPFVTNPEDNTGDDEPDEAAVREAIEARYDKYRLTDDNFAEPSFNPRVKTLAPCYPEIYEPPRKPDFATSAVSEESSATKPSPELKLGAESSSAETQQRSSSFTSSSPKKKKKKKSSPSEESKQQ